jgi:hypothetical protein
MKRDRFINLERRQPSRKSREVFGPDEALDRKHWRRSNEAFLARQTAGFPDAKDKCGIAKYRYEGLSYSDGPKLRNCRDWFLYI